MTTENHSDSSHGRDMENDIRQALDASQVDGPAGGESFDAQAVSGSAVLADSRWGALRYGMTKCGLAAEKYPWQTVAALLVTVGCGWVCSYFGASVLAALVLYAVFGEE